MKMIVPVAPVRFNRQAWLRRWLLLVQLGWVAPVTAAPTVESAADGIAEKAAASLSQPKRIHSPELGYDLQYRVYQPVGFQHYFPANTNH